MAVVTIDGTCPRCARPIERDRAVMLELNAVTGLYCEPGTVPEAESQGGFDFGADCAKAVLKNKGRLVRVGLARRLNG